MNQRQNNFDIRLAAVLSLIMTLAACTSKNPKQTASKTQEKADTQSSSATNSESLTPEEAANLTAIRQKIASDPRVKSKDFTVTIKHDKGTVIVEQGHVADYDEQFAVTTDVTSMTDYPTSEGVSVENPDPWEIGFGSTPPPMVETADKTEIPICPGLTVVTAVAQPDGDYESIKTVESVDEKKLVLKYSAETRDPWWSVENPPLKLTTARRNVLFEDMQSSHSYDQIFIDHGPEDATGSTSIGVSAEVLRDLKTKGQSDLRLCGDAVNGLSLGVDGKPKFTPGGCNNFWRFTVHRIENTTVPFRVLLNGMPVDVPAIHVKGNYGEDNRNEMFFLDDERNPLTLAFRFGIQRVIALTPHLRQLCGEARTKHNLGLGGDRPRSCDLPMGGDIDTLRVVKINSECRLPESEGNKTGPSPSGERALEQSLADTGKVDVYNIFFSFNSDTMREESEPTLKEIASILHKHRDWKLRIAGHTDGIGGDKSNLELSQHRAAAVKAALVKHYGIAADRLSTTGFGKAQPKDTNDTLEGRARNRRVELSKIN